jgi:hypothetical protein
MTPTPPALTPMYEKPVALLVSVLPFWMVSAPDVALPTKSVPLVALAAPEVPKTAGLGEVVLILVSEPAVGTPPVQFAALVQSVLAAPVHVCAAAEPAATAVSVAAETVVRRSWRMATAVPGRADRSSRWTAARGVVKVPEVLLAFKIRIARPAAVDCGKE